MWPGLGVQHGKVLELATHWRGSFNGATQKWRVFAREDPIKMDDLGVPPFMKTSNWSSVGWVATCGNVYGFLLDTADGRTCAVLLRWNLWYKVVPSSGTFGSQLQVEVPRVQRLEVIKQVPKASLGHGNSKTSGKG